MRITRHWLDWLVSAGTTALYSSISMPCVISHEQGGLTWGGEVEEVLGMVDLTKDRLQMEGRGVQLRRHGLLPCSLAQ